jgi:hypothetical protein
VSKVLGAIDRELGGRCTADDVVTVTARDDEIMFTFEVSREALS